MILVDSSAWIDSFRGTITPQTEILDRLLGNEPLGIGDLMLTEVLQGFANKREFDAARKMLASLTVVELGGREIAIQAAKIFRALRRRGVTVRKTIDTVIATGCIESGCDPPAALRAHSRIRVPTQTQVLEERIKIPVGARKRLTPAHQLPPLIFW